MKNPVLLKIVGSLCLFLGSIQNVNAEESIRTSVVGILTQEIVDAQPAPEQIRKELAQRLIEQPLKTTYELVPTTEGLDFSVAVTDVIESVPHYHSNLIETYTGVYGKVEVFIDDKSYIIGPGDIIVVPKKAVHWVRSVNGEKARMIVGCVPGWTPGDNHLIDDKAEKQPTTLVTLTPNVDTSITGLFGESELTTTELKDVPAHLYQRAFEFPTKKIRELITAEEGLGFSLALIDIVQGESSYHEGRSEIYTVVSGEVDVTINGESHILRRGDVIAVPLHAVHSVKSVTGEPARLLVSCIPGFILEDHHVVESP